MLKIYVLGFGKWEFDKTQLDALTEDELIEICKEDVEHVTVIWHSLEDFATDNNQDDFNTPHHANPSEYYIYFIYKPI